MKSIKSIKIYLLLLLITVMYSCNNEDLTSGNLKVTFSNYTEYYPVVIYPAENQNVSISNELTHDSNGTLTYNLNIGNYILRVLNSNVSYPQVGFQIKAGKTTEINFDENYKGSVQ